jgi:CRP/FNR family cyclic AMP-dependent transcriptional regulator
VRGTTRRWLSWIQDAEHVRRVSALSRAPVFAGLPRRLLARLSTRVLEKSYLPGDVVFRQGDPGRGLFVVLEGAVEVFGETPEGERRLATFEPGQSFGELALIDDQPRSATARVVAPTTLLILYRTHFEALVAGDGKIAIAVMQNLLRMLAGYVRSSNAGRSPAAETTAGSGAAARGS